MLTEQPSSETESEESTVKSEDDDMETNLYDGTPEPIVGPRAISHELSPQPDRFGEDLNLPTITEETYKLYDGMRMPIRVRDIAPLNTFNVSDEPNEEFAFNFLKKIFGGSQVSHGYYSISKPKTNGQVARLFPQLTSYMALSREYEPLLPRLPGSHGSQISSFMQYSQFEDLFPLFIKDADSGKYRYYGTYKEPCASDRLGSGEMAEVPRRVKEHWAEVLGSDFERGRARKNITALRELWPMVSVGWWDQATKTMIEYDEDLEDEYGELEVVKRLISEEEAEEITSEQIIAAFENPDFEQGPSVRLYFEYLQCVGYDEEFYRKLVAKKHELER